MSLTLEERSLHTGEVEGSIPSAPTILRDFLGSIRQLTTERNGKTAPRPGENPGTLFTGCSGIKVRLDRTKFETRLRFEIAEQRSLTPRT
jgi:hypothetical protein